MAGLTLAVAQAARRDQERAVGVTVELTVPLVLLNVFQHPWRAALASAVLVAAAVHGP
jgi:hypothetical protein